MNKLASAAATLPLMVQPAPDRLFLLLAQFALNQFSRLLRSHQAPGLSARKSLFTVQASMRSAILSVRSRDVGQPSQMANEPSVIPNLSSADGRAIVFNVFLSGGRLLVLAAGPLPIASIPTAPGTYGVFVTNSNGDVESVSFVVAR